MEKDYFKDRHPLVNEHDAILPGDEVFICLKNMQPYAKELQNLTKITVSNYLTSQNYHPRGQKVKGYEEIWDEESKEYIREERVGRITYKIIDKYVVPTTEGYKYIKKQGKNKLRLVTFNEIKDMFLLNLSLNFDVFSFKIILDPWKYFSNVEEAQDFIKKLNIKNAKLYTDKITLIVNGRPEEFKDAIVYYNNKRLDLALPEIFEFLVNNYESTNNSAYSFNKYFALEPDSFELKRPTEYVD